MTTHNYLGSKEDFNYTPTEVGYGIIGREVSFGFGAPTILEGSIETSQTQTSAGVPELAGGSASLYAGFSGYRYRSDQ